MSTLQIEERITVSAPPKRVWKFILDPARVAACLPGAKLDGTEGEDTFLGTMKVKVGPVVMEIKGKATMTDIDPVERRVTLSGTGNDKAGGGSARMEMKSQILEKEGGSEIVVNAEVHLAGKLVRFGRGMMEGISKQLFKQFAERVHTALDQDEDEDEDEGSDGDDGSSGDGDGSSGDGNSTVGDDKTPAEKAPAEKAPAEKAPAEKAPAEKAPAEGALADKAPADKAPADKAPADKAPADKAPADEAPAEEAAKASPEAASSEEAPETRKEIFTDRKAAAVSKDTGAGEGDTAASEHGGATTTEAEKPSSDGRVSEKPTPEKAESKEGEPASKKAESKEGDPAKAIEPAKKAEPLRTPFSADDSPLVETVNETPLAKREATSTPPEAESAAEPKAKAPSKSGSAGGKPGVRKKKPSTSKAIVPPEDNAPLDAGSLVWAAIWAWIKGLFARLFGGKKDRSD